MLESIKVQIIDGLPMTEGEPVLGRIGGNTQSAENHWLSIHTNGVMT